MGDRALLMSLLQRVFAQRHKGGEFLLFTGSTIFFQCSRLAVSLVAASLIGPEQFGVWNTLNPFLIYGSIITLGVPNGMNREVPFLIGKGRVERAKQVADQVFWFVLIASILGTPLAILALYAVIDLDRITITWVAILFVCWQIFLYSQARLRSLFYFAKTSFQQILFSLLLPIIVIPFSYFWGISGFIIGQSITTIIACLYVFWGQHPTIGGLEPVLIKSLINIGWPIMSVGVLYALLTTIDRWVIVATLGVTELGYYTVAALCFSALSLFPSVISQFFYPRMVRYFGTTNSVQEIVRLVYLQMVFTIAATLPFIVLLYLILPYLIVSWMPEYIPGIQSAQIILFGLPGLAVINSIGNFLNTISLQHIYLTVQIFIIFMNFVTGILLVNLGFGLSGVAFSMVFGVLVYAAILFFVFVLCSRRGTS